VANYHDLLDAVAQIRAATGNDGDWMTGLSASDISVVANPASPPAAVDAVFAKLTAAHPAIFGSGATAVFPQLASDQSEGAAAEAIRTAETALAQQHSQAALLDLQVVAAVLNAHTSHAESVAALERLQSEIEAAVTSRTDLDTPAGARGFQRYLIDKLRDIRTVVETADLDATSKAAMAAALASLYASSSTASGDVGEPSVRPQPPSEPLQPSAPVPSSASSPVPPIPADLGLDPLPPTIADNAFPPVDYPSTPVPVPPPAATTPMSGGWGGAAPSPGMPFGGGLPPLPMGSIPDFPSDPAGGPSPQGIKPHPDPVSTEPTDQQSADPTGQPSAGEDPDSHGASSHGANSVELPDGQIIIAPNPQLAAAITAAVAGTPIAEAFSAQGITIPAPGSAIANPVQPMDLLPGDVGLFNDRHALALGDDKALLDNKIQAIASMSGLGFIGWQRPPEPVVAPAPDVPAPAPPPQAYPR